MWGHTINVSADGAPGFATEVLYGASKYALESYSRAAAKELGRFGITVNIASLGPMQTGWITPEMEQDIARNKPLGRVGQPRDVADAIVLLATEQAAGSLVNFPMSAAAGEWDNIEGVFDELLALRASGARGLHLLRAGDL
ncbi:MAG: SDR family oxidoreductase [Roseiflexaceae bacterium]